MEAYSNLNTASLGTEYLMTNATTHSFIFGAMAELVDNARDAGSTALEIYAEEAKGVGMMLCFRDDGCGMTKEEADNVIVFGSSHKTNQEEPIGMYGNGLKSGSMRLGKDMILFTKKAEVLTCLMISRTFFQAENVFQIKVPVPSFDAATKKMIGKDHKKHNTELDLITKYSPFKDEKTLLKQFDKITSPSGTLVVIYNLSTTPKGELELDFKSDPLDIRTSIQSDDDDLETDITDVKERTSFRAYASILYKSPRMKIMLRGKRVRTRLLAYSLYLPKRITVQYKSFKNQSEKQITEAKQSIEVTKRRLTELQSEISKLTKTLGVTNRNTMSQLRRLQAQEAELSSQLAEKKGIMDLRKKQAKKSEHLEFFFGLNANERYHDGMFFYNADRLIKMYVKEGTLQSKDEITYRGIIAVVSVPKSSLLPTHNKQDFNDHAEYKKLKKCVDQAMQQYWEEVVMGEWDQNLVQGWARLGYSSDWRSLPSNEEQYKITRARIVKHLQQCDKCLKWRVIPYHKNYLYKDFPDNWQCSDSLDPSSKSCDKPEQLPKIDCQPLRTRSHNKQPKATVKESAKKTMSAAAQEQREKEERAMKRKNSTKVADDLYQVVQKKSKSFVHSPSLSKTSSSKTSRSKSPSIAFTTSRRSPSKAKPKSSKRSLSPETPPLRVMRRPSPSRTVKQEKPTPSPTRNGLSSKYKRNSSNNSDATESEGYTDSDVDHTPRKSAQASLNKSSSAVKVEDSLVEDQLNATDVTVRNAKNAKSKPTVTSPKKTVSKDAENKVYRMINMADILNKQIAVGDQIQGRYQNKWQDAEVVEIRPDNILVRYKNKTSLAMKVKNPDKNQSGELRIEVEDGFELINETDGSQPSSTTADDHDTYASQLSSSHQKLLSLVCVLDKTRNAETFPTSELADLDVLSMLTSHCNKIKEDTERAVKLAHQAEVKELQREVASLKTENNQLKQEIISNKKNYERREQDRFESIKTLFTRVLTSCIGPGPESRFSTHEELVSLLEYITESLSE